MKLFATIAIEAVDENNMEDALSEVGEAMYNNAGFLDNGMSYRAADRNENGNYTLVLKRDDDAIRPESCLLTGSIKPSVELTPEELRYCSVTPAILRLLAERCEVLGTMESARGDSESHYQHRLQRKLELIAEADRLEKGWVNS